MAKIELLGLSLVLLLNAIFLVVCDEDSYEIEDRSFMTKMGMCITTKDCKPHEYCEISTKKLFKLCRRKGDDGDYCLFDYRCMSGYCSGFTCKQRSREVRNIFRGCNRNGFCRPHQYCEKRTCKNKIYEGFCRSDQQCMSNNCSLFRCSNRRG